MIKRLALSFLGYSDKFDYSHLLFLLVLITSIFCLNTRARFLSRERWTEHVQLVLTAPLYFFLSRHIWDTYECIDSTPALTHALSAVQKFRGKRITQNSWSIEYPRVDGMWIHGVRFFSNLKSIFSAKIKKIIVCHNLYFFQHVWCLVNQTPN